MITATQESTIARQRRFWTRRAAVWEHTAADNPGLNQVIDAVVAAARPEEAETVVDLGCGSGQLTIPLARQAPRVIAVDVSARMTARLKTNTAREGIDNVEPVTAPIEAVDLPPGSADVVASSYALHHLRDRDKAALVAAAARWLKPGGRLVIGDMMFGRGAEARDREIIASKVATLARRGPAGWWRIAKNAARYLGRMQERPVSMSAWARMLEEAGFRDVSATPVVAEAAVVHGVRPERLDGRAA